MRVLDTGRTTDYDFSHQNALYASAYDVVWQLLRVQWKFKTIDQTKRTVATSRFYIDSAKHDGLRLLRLFRVLNVITGIPLSYLKPDVRDLVDQYHTDIAIEYRQLKRQIGSLDISWDWNYVRKQLAKLVVENPLDLLDILENLKDRGESRKYVREEYNYFVMLCKEALNETNQYS